MIFLFALLIVSAGPWLKSAVAIQSNLYIAIPLDGTKCVEVNLPQDSGSTGAGKYSLVVETELSTNYRDYETTLVETSTMMNNICFTAKQSDFNSGDVVDYKITVSSETAGTTRIYSGKVCISADESLSDEECAAMFGQAGNQGGDGVAGLCVSGQKRCNANVLEQCNSAGSAWVTVQTCESGCANSACIGSGSSGQSNNLYIIVIILGIVVIVVLLLVVVLKNSKRIEKQEEF